MARESAASVALTGGPRSPAVAWLALPVVTLAARFNARGVSVGVAIAATLIVVSTFGVNPPSPQPTLKIWPSPSRY